MIRTGVSADPIVCNFRIGMEKIEENILACFPVITVFYSSMF